MKKFKKVLSTAVAFTLVLSACAALSSCGKEKKDDKFTVGICQLTQHEALDAATQGFKDALTEEFGDKVEFDFQNASGDSNTCSTIVNSFVSKNVDLIMANATPALQAAYNATDKIPILGTSVTEYSVALNLENYTGVVGGNVSGTSDLAPLDDQAQMILDYCPNAKNVGLIYCSAEPNSEYQVKFVEDFLADKGVNAMRFSFSDSNDIASVVTKAAAACDILYVPTDNTAASCADTIGNIVKSNKKPVITGEAGVCKKCGIATLSISYYDLGVQTGKMAAKILKGEADISEMKVEYATAQKQFNSEMCTLLGITPLEGYTAIE